MDWRRSIEDSCAPGATRFYGCDDDTSLPRRRSGRGATGTRHLVDAFRDCFTAPVWKHVLVLVAGAVLAPGKRTVSEALRVMGPAARPGFARYHEVLSRVRWDARAVARRLLAQVLDVFLPAGEVVIGIDDTIERRWGARIKARGIYRDPVRSSHGHFVKASGLRWLSLMVVVPIPWAGRRWALPLLTVLARQCNSAATTPRLPVGAAI